jgi:hypothetical protein
VPGADPNRCSCSEAKNEKGLHRCKPWEFDGGRGRNRTADTGIFNKWPYDNDRI